MNHKTAHQLCLMKSDGFMTHGNYLWSTPNGKYFFAGMTKNGLLDMSNVGMFRLFIPGGN